MKRIPFSMLKKEVAAAYAEYIEEEYLDEIPQEFEDHLSEIKDAQTLEELYDILESSDSELIGPEFVINCFVDETE